MPCLENWLKLAGASTRKARHLAMRAEVKRSGLDDRRVKELSTFVIGILLGFDEDLAGALKSCVCKPIHSAYLHTFIPGRETRVV